MVAVGIAIGLPTALLATRLVAARLAGVSGNDPATFGVATLITGILAGLSPAARASRIDPHDGAATRIVSKWPPAVLCYHSVPCSFGTPLTGTVMPVSIRSRSLNFLVARFWGPMEFGLKIAFR